MKNLGEIAKGMILVGAITTLLYGSHAFQRDREIKKQLSFGQRQPIVQEVYKIKDYASKGMILGLGLLGVGATIFYFSRRESD